MKLVENLKAIDTGNRRRITEPLYSIHYGSGSPESQMYPAAREYSIVVTLGTNQWIDEQVIRHSDGKAIEYAVDQMKHQILEKVCGEFYRDLHKLQFELRNELGYRDSPTLKKLDDIMDKITL